MSKLEKNITVITAILLVISFFFNTNLFDSRANAQNNFVCEAVNGKCYYVSPNGSDSNDGSFQNPFRTVQKAANIMQAGDVTYIREGFYSENMITFAHTGTNDNWITLKAYPGETPIIDGGFEGLNNGRVPVFDIDGVHYIIIDGLTIQRGSMAGIFIAYDYPTSHIIIQNNEIRDIRVNDNTAAVYVSTNYSDVIIRNNKLHPETTIRGAGVELFRGANNIVIENNEIYNTNKGVYYKHGVNNSSNKPIIRNNLIHDVETYGIKSSTDNAVIENNVLYNTQGIKIYHESTGCGNVGAFYNRIIHNTIIGGGILLLQPSSSCADRGARHTYIENNLVYGGSFTIWPYVVTSDRNHDTKSDYNLWGNQTTFREFEKSYSSLDSWQNALGLDLHSIQGEPIFNNPNNHDYSLAPGSPGKNAASDGKDIGADFSLVGIQNGSSPTFVCGDGICDSNETCLADNCCSGQLYDSSSEVCCSGSIFTGNCCSDAQCVSGEICINHTCNSQPSLNECDNWQTKHPEWIWCDDFEDSSKLSKYFEYNNDNGEFIPVQGVGLGGSKGMRARWQAGEVDAGNLKISFGRIPNSYMQKGIRPNEDFREIYFRFYLKMQPGWEGNPHKLARTTIFYSPNDWSQAMIAHLWEGSNNGNNLGVDPVRCVGTDNKPKCHGYNDFSNMDWLGHKEGATQIFDTSNSGKWFCVEAHVKLNDPGKSNGVQEFWINGNLDARSDNLNFVRNYTDYGINAAFFENYWGGGSPKIQDRYFDNLVISTQRIGCLSTTPISKTGDFDSDGNIDIFDLLKLLSKWGTNDANADLNGSGNVDIFDLLILLQNWGS